MSTFDHLQLPYPEVTEYLDYAVDVAMNGQSAIEQKVKVFREFCAFMFQDLGIPELKEIHAEHLQQWLDSLKKGDRLARETMKLYCAIIFTMWRWTIAKGYHEAEEVPTLKQSNFKFQGRPPKEKRILTPEAIFKARTAGYGALHQAVLFEISLCTGMRSNEVLQLRANDILWGKIPTDKELQMPSPYVAATIYVEPQRHAIKQRSPRKVFLSKLAAKLLLLWMQDRRIPQDSNIPLFPFSKNGTFATLNKMAKRVKLETVAIHDHGREAPAYDVDQMFAMEDVDLNNVEDNLLRSMIRNRRALEAKKNRLYGVGPVGKKKDRYQPTKRTSQLNPHVLRYTHIGIMFYRLFTGERQNEFALQISTAHSINRVMRAYLVDNDLIKNDITWKTLWLGKPDHWKHLFTISAQERMHGQYHQSGYRGKWGKDEAV